MKRLWTRVVWTITILGVVQTIHAGDIAMHSVTISIEGSNVTYSCGEYVPVRKLLLSGDGTNRYDSPLSIVSSQFTQMHLGNWSGFVDLWDDFNAVYRKAGMSAPTADKFIESWSGMTTGNEHWVRYVIELGVYTIVVVDTKTRKGEFVDRTSSTVKKLPDGTYKLTRDLSLNGHPLERVTDDVEFDPLKAVWKKP